jgi:TetR/AcrR family fatty acid metabolism transcriptional regulator
MTPKIVDKEAKRKQILVAALTVFTRKGIHDFRMIEIAEAANVGKGTLYEYFPSKDDLIVGCFSLFMSRFNDHVATQLSDVTDPVEKIKKLISATFEFCLTDRALFDTIFDFYAAGIPRRDGKSLLTELTPMYTDMIEWVSTVIDDGVSQGRFIPTDSKVAASSILALLDGLFFQLALGVISVDSTDFANKISEILLNGLLNHKNVNP